MQEIRILVPSQILVILCFFGSFDSYCLSKIGESSRPESKNHFDTYYIRRQSLNLPEKLAENHNICVIYLRILVLFQIY